MKLRPSSFASGVILVLGTAGSAYAWFDPIPAVPEPETYALMLAGLGVVGGALRRRSKKNRQDKQQ